MLIPPFYSLDQLGRMLGCRLTLSDRYTIPTLVHHSAGLPHLLLYVSIAIGTMRESFLAV